MCVKGYGRTFPLHTHTALAATRHFLECQVIASFSKPADRMKAVCVPLRKLVRQMLASDSICDCQMCVGISVLDSTHPRTHVTVSGGMFLFSFTSSESFSVALEWEECIFFFTKKILMKENLIHSWKVPLLLTAVILAEILVEAEFSLSLMQLNLIIFKSH